MKILITGGTGFVGYWMAETQPDHVYILSLNHFGYDLDFWEKDEQNWDYIIHLAPVSPTRVLRYAKSHGTRVLFASSGAVYDRTTEYAGNKRIWEQECLNSEVDVVIARLFTFFGSHLDEDKAFSRFCKAAQAGEPIRIWGDGSTVRSYMSGERMGKWLWAILLKGESGEAYDVGSDEPVTMLELARSINYICGNKSEIVFENRPDECPYYMPRNTKKTRRLLRE